MDLPSLKRRIRQHLSDKELIALQRLPRKYSPEKILPAFCTIYSVRLTRKVLFHERTAKNSSKYLHATLVAAATAKALFLLFFQNTNPFGAAAFNELLDELQDIGKNCRVQWPNIEDLRSLRLEAYDVSPLMFRVALPTPLDYVLQLFEAGEYESCADQVSILLSDTETEVSSFERGERFLTRTAYLFNLTTLAYLSLQRSSERGRDLSRPFQALKSLRWDVWQERFIKILNNETPEEFDERELSQNLIRQCQYYYYRAARLIYDQKVHAALPFLKRAMQFKLPCIEHHLAQSDYQRCLSSRKQSTICENERRARILLLKAGDLHGLRRLRPETAKDLCKSISRDLGTKHPYYGQAQNYLGLAFSEEQSIRRARRAHRRALTNRLAALGSTHFLTAQSLHNLGTIYKHQQVKRKAEHYLSRALEIRRTVLGPFDDDYLRTVVSLSGSYAASENKVDDEDLVIEATNALPYLRLSNRALPEKQSSYLYQLTIANLILGRIDDARRALRTLITGDDHLIPWLLSYSTELQRRRVLETMRWRMESYVCLVAGFFADNPEVVKDCFDLYLRRKGISIEAATVRKRLVEANKDKRLTSESKEQLQSLVVSESASSEIGLHGETIGGLINSTKQTPQDVSAFDRFDIKSIVDTDAIAASIPKDASLIEFVKCPSLRPIDQGLTFHYGPQFYTYFAFVINPNISKLPKLIKFDNAVFIDYLVMALRLGITSESESMAYPIVQSNSALVTSIDQHKTKGSVDFLPEILRTALTVPIVENTGDSTHLIISPDGGLWRLPFEALPYENDALLIDRYLITYLGAARDLVAHTRSRSKHSKSVVIADPNYDLGVDLTRKDIAIKAFIKSLLMRSPSALGDTDIEQLLSSPLSDKDARGKHLHFRRLTATREEGLSIAAMLNVVPCLDNCATSDALSQLDSPLVLHLATHGFFLNRWLSTTDLPELAKLNPMFCSGLAFAGANAGITTGSLTGSGLLTAEEISNLSLSGTELVVLSACETALGDLHPTEGVLGMRAAFLIAGANSLVISLWKVPDKETKELMEFFYGRLLEGVPRASALREAKLYLRQKNSNPLFWAGFICQGAWSPISFNP